MKRLKVEIKLFYKTLNFQHKFWKVKVRVNWINFIDRNTNFFNKLIKIRQTYQKINNIINEDYVLDYSENIN